MALTLLRKIRSASKLSPFVLFWFPLAWVGLGIFRAAILAFSFKKLSFLFGTFNGIEAGLPLTSMAQINRALQIRKLVSLAAKNTPWQSNCFPQAIVARLFMGLYRVPYTMFFGLSRSDADKTLKAHAWVHSGPCAVSGGFSFDEYTVVACYGSQSWKTGATQ